MLMRLKRLRTMSFEKVHEMWGFCQYARSYFLLLFILNSEVTMFKHKRKNEAKQKGPFLCLFRPVVIGRPGSP